MYKRPNPGDVVTFATRYGSNLIDKEFDNTVYETVDVLEPFPWCGIDEFVIAAEDEPFITERVIKMKNVILFEIHGRSKEATKEGVNYVQVPGSKGNTYSVRIENGVGKKCDCVGFQYRNRCRHLEEGTKIFEGLLTQG